MSSGFEPYPLPLPLLSPQHRLHLLLVALESRLAALAQPADGARGLPLEGLLDLDVTRGLQIAQVRGQVALGQVIL